MAAGVVEGDRLRVKDTTNDLVSDVLEVAEEAIVVYPADSPTIIDVDAATALVVRGVNLSRVTEVSLRQQFVDTSTPLTLVLEFEVALNGKSMTVQIPVLGDAWDGYAVVFCAGAGGASASDYGMLKIAACKQAAAGGGGSRGG